MYIDILCSIFILYRQIEIKLWVWYHNNFYFFYLS